MLELEYPNVELHHSAESQWGFQCYNVLYSAISLVIFTISKQLLRVCFLITLGKWRCKIKKHMTFTSINLAENKAMTFEAKPLTHSHHDNAQKVKPSLEVYYVTNNLNKWDRYVITSFDKIRVLLSDASLSNIIW